MSSFHQHIISLAIGAGVGSLATLASIYITKKIIRVVKERKKSKMKLFHDDGKISTRAMWMIAELDAERDFEFKNIDEIKKMLPRSISTHDEFLALPLRTAHLEDDVHGLDASSNFSSLDIVHLDDSNDYPTSDEDDISWPDYPDPDTYDIQPTIAINDELTMVEGAAICMFLADVYKQFLPPDDQKSDYYKWILYSSSTFDNIMKVLQNQLVDSPDFQRNSDLLEPALRGFDLFARELSEILDKQQYLCGNCFTAADVVTGFTLWWAKTIENGTLLLEYPVLSDYLSRLSNRPAFRKTFGCIPDIGTIHCLQSSADWHKDTSLIKSLSARMNWFRQG